MEQRRPLKQYFFKEKGERKKEDRFKMLFILFAVLLILGITCFPMIYNFFDTQDNNDISDEYKSTDIIHSIFEDNSSNKDPRK